MLCGGEEVANWQRMLGWRCLREGVIPKWQLNWALTDLGKEGGEMVQVRR